ncbi:MAG: hypothetical protein KA113_09085 [Syntrophaceae bacterium]|nr:hypothetical protein [Syntrophaceae bacterium]
MAWEYSNPACGLSLETERELSDTLTRETWPEGTIRTDGETEQVWRGEWIDV